MDRTETGLVAEATDLASADIQIESAADYDYAAAHLKDVRRMEKTIKEFFKPIKQKMDAAKREVLDREKEALRPVLDARKRVENRMTKYLALIAERREHEMELAKKQAAKDAKKAGVDSSLVPVEEPRTEVPKTDGISAMKYWDFEVITPKDVHPDFLVPDEKKIRPVVKAMGMEAEKRIGGIRVFQKQTIKTRLN